MCEITVEPLLIPDTAAAALAGVSRATWHRRGPPSVRLGRKVLWRRAEIVTWIDAGCPAPPPHGLSRQKATETLATELERRAIRLAAGIVDQTDEHAKRPLAEHLADYVRYLEAKGDTPKHVRQTETRASATLDACRFVRIGDLQSSPLLAFLSDCA